MIKQSFTLRVLVISFLVLALPLLIDSFIFFQNSYNHSITHAKLDLKEAAKFRAFTFVEIQPIKHVLLNELNFLLDLGEREGEFDSDRVNQLIQEVAHIGGNFELFILGLSKEGEYKIRASSDPVFLGTDFTSFVKLNKMVEEGEGTFLRYTYSQAESRYIPTIVLLRVITSKERREPIGILLAVSKIENQLESILSIGEVDKNTHFAILNNDGIVYAATDSRLRGRYFDPLSQIRKEEILRSTQLGIVVNSLTPLPIIRGDDPPYFEFIFDDQVQIAYRAYASDYGISIVAYSAKETFFARAVRHFLFVYTVYALILVMGGGVAYWLSLWISRPLRQLSHVMGEVAEGNLAVRFKKEPFGYEINLLGEIFNETLANLLQNIQKAEDERVKMETYQRELAIGREVQESLLPSKVPQVTGAEIGGVYLPAIDVGGDYYGFMQRKLRTGEEVVVITVADAAGKGIPSCLYALSARSLFQTFINIVDDPGEALSRTNNAFIENAGETGMFITLLAAMYHTGSKILSYYSCGHVPAIVCRRDGRVVLLAHSGMALGLKESTGYPSDSIQLETGDLVVFYTKGLMEHFSEKRLISFLQRMRGERAQEVVERVAAELGGTPQEEEVIIVALRVT